MIISKLFLSFIVFSLVGWLWESIYCTVTNAKWQNRGFLYGPICPIYGVGAIGMLMAFGFIPGISTETASLHDAPIWQVFLICAVGSAVLEYTTSYLMEKIFDARWWDYTDMPLNINGRICLPATLLFGFAGTALIKIVLPKLVSAAASLDNVSPLVWEGFSLVFMAIFAADFVLTIANMTQLVAKLDKLEEEFNTIMDEHYKVVGDKQLVLKQKIVDVTSDLNTRQRYVLRNIKRKGSHAKEEVTTRVKDYLGSLKAGVVKDTHAESDNHEA